MTIINILAALFSALFGTSQAAATTAPAAQVVTPPAISAPVQKAADPTAAPTPAPTLTPVDPPFVVTTNDGHCRSADVVQTTVIGQTGTWPECYEQYDGSQVSACIVYLPDGTWQTSALPDPTGPDCSTSVGDGYQNFVYPNAINS